MVDTVCGGCCGSDCCPGAVVVAEGDGFSCQTMPEWVKVPVMVTDCVPVLSTVAGVQVIVSAVAVDPPLVPKFAVTVTSA